MQRILRRYLFVCLCCALDAHGAVVPPGVHCAATAEAAVNRWLALTIADEDAAGYRVLRIQQDGLHHRRWAIVERCGHPETPHRALEMADDASQSFEEQSSVRIGDTVRVVRRSDGSNIELTGVTLGAANTGEIVRVRLRAVSAEVGAPLIELRCRVVAKGLVEVWQ